MISLKFQAMPVLGGKCLVEMIYQECVTPSVLSIDSHARDALYKCIVRNVSSLNEVNSVRHSGVTKPVENVCNFKTRVHKTRVH